MPPPIGVCGVVCQPTADGLVLSCLLTLYTAVMSFEILFPFGLWVSEPGWLLNHSAHRGLSCITAWEPSWEPFMAPCGLSESRHEISASRFRQRLDHKKYQISQLSQWTTDELPRERQRRASTSQRTKITNRQPRRALPLPCAFSSTIVR